MTATITVQTLLDWPTEPAAVIAPTTWEPDDVDAAIARVRELTCRPDVAAVIARFRSLIPAEIDRLEDTARRHFTLYRAAQSAVKHRVRRSYGPYWRNLSAVNSWVWDQVAQGRTFVSAAVEDAIYVLLVGGLLSDDERRLFDTPWREATG